MYYLYSTTHAAFVSKGLGKTSDINEAKSFTKEEIMEHCKRHIKHDDQLGLIPVPVELIEEITRK